MNNRYINTWEHLEKMCKFLEKIQLSKSKKEGAKNLASQKSSHKENSRLSRLSCVINMEKDTNGETE